mgnify:CR=1 FL=1
MYFYYRPNFLIIIIKKYLLYKWRIKLEQQNLINILKNYTDYLLPGLLPLFFWWIGSLSSLQKITHILLVVSIAFCAYITIKENNSDKISTKKTQQNLDLPKKSFSFFWGRISLKNTGRVHGFDSAQAKCFFWHNQ